MIYGLMAALAWGSADFGAALMGRRIGSFATLVAAQFAGIVLFGILAATGVFALPRYHPGLLFLPLIGVAGALSYVAFYRALELGPIALVSPIGAGYAAIVIALSLLFLHEYVAPLALGGAAVTITGVVLASAGHRGIQRARRGDRGGAFFAVLAMVGFGVAAFLIGVVARDDGWFGTILLARLGSAVTLATILLAPQTRTIPVAVFRRALPALAIGVLDIGGFALYAKGAEVGRVSITAAASVIYPLVPILAGVIHLRERPAATQWLGVASVGAGLVMLTLGR